MRDLPVVLDGYRLTVVEPPMSTTWENDAGNATEVINPDGAMRYVVSLFAKQRVDRGQRAPKGEQITVVLPKDPGRGFEADTRVELIEPLIELRSVRAGDRTVPPLTFRAAGMRRAEHTTSSGRTVPVDDHGADATS